MAIKGGVLKDPEAFINNLEDKDAKLTLEFYMQIV